MAADHKSKLRRLRVLQRLAQAKPNPVGELALLDALRADPELDPAIPMVRESMRYLAQHNLVMLIKVEGVPWLAAALTINGTEWLSSPGDNGLEIYNPGELPDPPPSNYNGRVSSVETLPTEIKVWLDQELVRLGFRDYTGLAESLKEQGWNISRSAVGRYGKHLKERIKQQKEKAEVIRSLADVFEEGAPEIMQGAMGAALTAVMDAIQEGEYSTSRDTLSSLVSTLPRIGKGLRDAERHKIEQETRRKTIEEAAHKVEEVARAQGLDDEWARGLREKFLKGM